MKKSFENGAYLRAMQRGFSVLGIFTVILMLNLACEENTEMPTDHDPLPPTDNDSIATDPPDDPTGQIDPDILSEYLMLGDAVKMTGQLTTPADGQLKIDVQDTIYLIKGYPYGDKIQITQAAGQTSRTSETHISGMYVQVVGSQTYYDAPAGSSAMSTVWIDEMGDHHTTYTFNLDFEDFSEVEEAEYPLSTDIIIQPHDEAGTPLDEFERTVTIEDPENSCNDIRNPLGSFWEWEFSITIDPDGNVEELSAPGLRFDLGDFAKGCCGGVGPTTQWPSYPGCHDQSPTWVELPIDPYYVPLFEFLELQKSGWAYVSASDVERNLDRSHTNLCTLEPVYLYNKDIDNGTGTHDFTPGATRLTLDFPNFSSFAKPIKFTEIVYTCHSLVMSANYGEGGSIGKVYKRTSFNDTDRHAFYWYE